MSDELNTAFLKLMAANECFARVVEQAVKDLQPPSQEEVLNSLFQPILKAMKKYGKNTSLTIYRDGSITLSTGDGERFWPILASCPTLYEFLTTSPDQWPSLKKINSKWGCHAPPPRSGDYRDRETWQYGALKEYEIEE